MHLDAHERTAGMPALASLVAECGQVVMPLRHRPVPYQRRMYDVTAEDFIARAVTYGLAYDYQGRRADMQRRDVVLSSVVALRQQV